MAVGTSRRYNDTCGVTAAFTLNSLRHVNALAGTDFDWRGGWRHVAEYDEPKRAILTTVEAVGPQAVSCGGKLVRRRPRLRSGSARWSLPYVAARRGGACLT